MLVVMSASTARLQNFSDWLPPVNAETIPGTSSQLNTPFNDGCPIQSPDGLSLYIASNRPGGFGGQDIWIAHRATTVDAWGDPEHLPFPINSSADDFCPSPARGHRLFFVSARGGADSCGGADIYLTRLGPDGWEQPQNLGCQINSPAGEASPSYFEDDTGQEILYFSSNRVGGFSNDIGAPDSDIYFSVNFGPAQLDPTLNTAAEDSRPNVRHNGREIVWDSTRPLTLGGPDIWTATRETTADNWSNLIHFEAPINSSANETRASLSWDGTTMVFGSTRPDSELGSNGLASNDIYITNRSKTNSGLRKRGAIIFAL
jgi:WD40-like Beta Propeller Repeat